MSQIQSPPQDRQSETKFPTVQAIPETVEPPLQPSGIHAGYAVPESAGIPSTTQQTADTASMPIPPALEPSPFQPNTEVTLTMNNILYLTIICIHQTKSQINILNNYVSLQAPVSIPLHSFVCDR